MLIFIFFIQRRIMTILLFMQLIYTREWDGLNVCNDPTGWISML
ncbi:hypothetical protein GLYMA_11G174491v4 [Glycine max]|nr:hypothetical protein GLYMA_11G174491v4 [Glycine max]KAH1115804.1 hypothetical protein GYH30_057097 [Glycine max]